MKRNYKSTKQVRETALKHYYENKKNSIPTVYWFVAKEDVSNEFIDVKKGDVLYVGSTMFFNHRIQRHMWCLNHCNDDVKVLKKQKIEHKEMYKKLSYVEFDIEKLEYENTTPCNLRMIEEKTIIEKKPYFNKRVAIKKEIK